MGENVLKIKKEIEENQIMVVVVGNKAYANQLKSITLHLSQTFKKVCYVNLNKPAGTLLKEFEKYKIDVKKLYFVDATRYTDKYERVLHISSPKALTELTLAIDNTISLAKIDFVIFDSLSTLLIYHDPATVVRFTHNLMSLLRRSDTKTIFISLKEDMKTDFMMDLIMFADKIVNL